MTKIQTFTFESGSTITSAWDKLKDHRRKLAAAKPSARNAYDDDALLLVLIRALPTEYKVTFDTLNAQRSLAVDERLQTLEAKHADIQEEEHAHPAFRVKKHDSKYVPPQRCGRQDSESSSGNTTSDYTCHLCGEKHFLRNCPHLKFARKAVRERIRDKSNHRSSSRPSESNAVVKSSDKKVHFHRSLSPSPSHKKSNLKSKAFTAETEASDSSTDSGDDDEEETVFLSKESISKALPSAWPADTGASSHMSDQRELFRELKSIPRRPIRVGGGVIYSWEKGNTNLMCEDGSSMLLSDILYVPGLGVNLLSARRVCQAGLKARFDDTHMYFKLGRKKVIEATMNEGLYIVTHVAKGFEETALTSNDIMQDTIENTPTSKKPRKEQPELTEGQKEVSEHKAFSLALIHFDIAGPFPVSLRGNKYFLLIVDSWSRMNWTLPLKHKRRFALHD
jgi:hypothetical protein